MKKVLFIFAAVLLFLAGCSASKNELKEFTETYNENAYEFVSVELLKEDKFGEIREEKYGNWQKLYSAEDRYTIEAKLDEDKKIKGYHINISGNEPYERLTGEGFEASQVIAETIGLDRDKFLTEYEKALNSGGEDISYSDAGYKVNLFEITHVEDHGGIIINYDKEK